MSITLEIDGQQVDATTHGGLPVSDHPDEQLINRHARAVRACERREAGGAMLEDAASRALSQRLAELREKLRRAELRAMLPAADVSDETLIRNLKSQAQLAHADRVEHTTNLLSTRLRWLRRQDALASAQVSGAPPTYLDEGVELKMCHVCFLEYVPGIEGFYTQGCEGCDPAADLGKHAA